MNNDINRILIFSNELKKKKIFCLWIFNGIFLNQYEYYYKILLM